MPMDRSLYPPEWERVSYLVRVMRAGNQCECTGECHQFQPFGHKRRCEERNYADGRFQNGKIILTTAHVCACNPLCATLTHLLAMCQSCHLRFDRYVHPRIRRMILGQEAPKSCCG